MRSLTKTIGAVLCLPVMLNSCYFNSTGSLIDKAQYEARANAADLNVSPNPVVYQNGSHYYIELPRYRYGHSVKLQYSVFDQESPMEASLERQLLADKITAEEAYMKSSDKNRFRAAYEAEKAAAEAAEKAAAEAAAAAAAGAVQQ